MLQDIQRHQFYNSLFRSRDGKSLDFPKPDIARISQPRARREPEKSASFSFLSVTASVSHGLTNSHFLNQGKSTRPIGNGHRRLNFMR